MLLFPGDLLNWSGIKHRVHSLDFLKVPHHGGSAEYLNDHALLSRMFPSNGKWSVISTCAPSENCGAAGTRPDPGEAFGKLHEYSRGYVTAQNDWPYSDFVFHGE